MRHEAGASDESRYVPDPRHRRIGTRVPPNLSIPNLQSPFNKENEPDNAYFTSLQKIQ